MAVPGRNPCQIPNQEQPTVPSKTLKEMALTRHGEAIQRLLTEVKHLRERQAVHDLIGQVRKHIEAQHILARDLLNQEHD